MGILNQRYKYILPLVKGKNVLNIGATHGDIHEKIKEMSKSCLSIDIEPNFERGIIKGDAETFKTGIKFDIIIAGELIEHLNNPGLFLECCQHNLKKEGLLILSTPNPYSASNLFNYLFKGKERYCEGHTCFFTKTTLDCLLLRHNFAIIDSFRIRRNEMNNFGDLVLYLINLIPLFRATTIYIIEKDY